MHEYSIVASLIERVQHETTIHGGTRVHKVFVKIGEFAGVEVDLLETAFDTFRERTICETAVLSIEHVEAAWVCRSCERPVARGTGLCCERCGGPATMTQGDEIILQRIEMEATDV